MFEKEKMILMLVVVFTVCLGLMAVFFILLINRFRISMEKRQRESLNNLIIGQDNERERISRDLHDQMGPQINAIRLFAESLQVNDPQIMETLNIIKEELVKASTDVRNISHDLMSISLRKYGLMEAIGKLIERTKHDQLQIEFNSNTDALFLSDRQISHFYNIIKELIYNTVKHADANRVEIQFDNDAAKNLLKFSYSDNGKGNASYDMKSDGIGIVNIHTRVMLMGGEIVIKMNKGFIARMNLKY